jgi:hypothetical protein
MGSLATFKSTYLTADPPMLPAGQRQRLAGPVYALETRVAAGATYGAAQNAIATKRTMDIVLNAQKWTNPYNANLASDFLTINAA